VWTPRTEPAGRDRPTDTAQRST